MREPTSTMTTEVLLGRMRDFALIGVNQTASLIMGGVFAEAAVVFAEILRTGEDLPVRLSAWAYGVTAAIASLDGFIRRSVIDGRPVLRAVPLVGAAGVLSMLGFALLGPQTGGADGWRYSQLVVLLVGVLFGQAFGSSKDPLADHLEPVLRPLYEAHAERMRRRSREGWPMLLAAAAPWLMAMADKYGSMSLQWPIAGLNVLLCVAWAVSIARSQRYYASLYDRVYAVHETKLELAEKPVARPPRARKTAAKATAKTAA